MNLINKLNSNFPRFIWMLSMGGLCISLSFLSFAYNEESQAVESVKQAQTVQTKDTVKSKTNNSTYVIETLVQGSQEQPNVIYITPWQANEKAINIEGQSLQVSLPKPIPVTPKTFKNKLHQYYKN
ncbi:hypothetical protein ACM9HF_02115 [Colwellia sp. RE-S-Sl-9]